MTETPNDKANRWILGRFMEAQRRDAPLMLWALIVGTLAGLVGGGFRYFVERLADLRVRFDAGALGLGPPGPWEAAGLSALLAMAAVWLVRRYAPEASGSGVQEVEGALDGIRPVRWWRVLPVKFGAGALAMSSGLLMGREGPTIQMGAALGPVRPGYLRRATIPATEREPARGPFFDEVDPEWAPTIEEAFEMVASGKPPWIVAQWLNERGLPKTSNWQRPEWTEPNVVALIRNRIYVGLGVFRTTVAQQIRSTGKTRQVPNDPEEILVNELPHLRIVSDSLRRQAIEAIDSRARSSVSGSEHVLYGIPRDSRGPLSRIIVCDICSHPLHATGRNEGGYRCRGANKRDCWNRTTALRPLAHERIAEAICQALLEFLPEAETLLAAARVQLEDTDRLDARLAELTTQHEEATAKYEQYGEAVGEGGDIVILVERLRHFEELRAGIDAEIERLRAERDVVVVPSYDELRQSILDRSRRIELMDRDARADLVDIVEEIRAVPFQQFGGNKVVLRAAIHLNLTGLLPWTVRSYIESLNEGSECVSVTTEFQKLIWVDLFNASNSPRYAMKVRALREAGRKFADIAGLLGLAEMAAKRADALGKEMRAAGLTDPFVRLTEPPANASRWRDTRRARNNSTDNGEADAA